MDAALQALAEPRRREILGLVKDRELTVGEIAAQFRGHAAGDLAASEGVAGGGPGDRPARRHSPATTECSPRASTSCAAFLEGFWDVRLEAAEGGRRGRCRSEAAGVTADDKRNRGSRGHASLGRARGPDRGVAGDYLVLPRGRRREGHEVGSGGRHPRCAPGRRDAPRHARRSRHRARRVPRGRAHSSGCPSHGAGRATRGCLLVPRSSRSR